MYQASLWRRCIRIFTEQKSIEEVIETIQDTVNTAFTMIPEIDGTHGIDFRDYDYIKDLLVVELERSEFNGEHLSHGIFEKQPIGALVLYLRLEQKNQLVMARLGRDVLEVCGVSQSTMMKQAMENTIKINPPVVMPVDTNDRFLTLSCLTKMGEMERLPSLIREC